MGAMSEAGFQKPTYAEILAGQEQRAKEWFGPDMDTGEQSVMGKFLRIISYDMACLYEELEGVYFARFPGYAHGVDLDRLMPFAGIRRNPALAAVHPVRFTGQPGAEVAPGFLLATAAGVSFRVEEPFTIGADGTALAKAVCTQRGPVGNVGGGEISIIVNPDARIFGMAHLSPPLVWGRDSESDPELRRRFSQAVAGVGSATLDAVKAAVLRVEGVASCVILENRGDSENEAGIPPHSFKAFVLADAVGDFEIAQAIFSKKPLGIKSWGDIEVQVPDSAGNLHPVGFSRVEKVMVRVRVTVHVDNTFPLNGKDRIGEKVAAYLASFANGQDLAHSSLYPVIYSVPGVVDVDGLVLSDDGGKTFAAKNIPMSPWQAVRTDKIYVDVEAAPYVDQ